MFCASGLVFGGTEGVPSRLHVFGGTLFHVLRSRTRFWRYRGVGSRFHILRSRTHFQRYRGSRVPFSYFAHPDSFSAIPRALGPVFIFLRSRTRFRRYRGHRVSFSCFALPNSSSEVLRPLGPVFMFFALGLVFGGTEGVPSHFHVLRARTRFRRYRGRWVPFSCFALTDSFLAVPRESCPVFMFCAPGLFFCGTEGVESRFHVLRFRTCFAGTEGVPSRFQRYRGS
jgi:hypothetical protein